MSGASQRSQAGDRSRASQAGDAQGEESEGEEDDDTGDEFVFVEAEEPRDQWDCESITSTIPLPCLDLVIAFSNRTTQRTQCNSDVHQH